MTPTRLAVLALLLTALSAPAGAAGVSCHCFKDRSFDPQAPAAVDPYLLATTQNSLLAAAFDISKNTVVRAKMTGTDGGRLWVAHTVGRAAGRDPGELLEARDDAASWAEALAAAGVVPPPELAAAGDDAALATAAVDRVLTVRLGAAPAALAELRTAGATDAETILAVYLGLRTGRPAPELYREVRDARATWGGLLQASGLAPEGVEEDLTERLR